MDPDEIARLVDELKLAKSNPSEVVNLEEEDIHIGEEKLFSCLAAKILSAKAINRDAFRQQLPRILQSGRRIDVEATGDNTYVLEFHSMRDRVRALSEGLWNFSRNILIFKEPSGWNRLRLMTFGDINIWTQLHNISLALMHEELLLKLGSQLGHVVELDRGENGTFLGRFARIRVCINIMQPPRKCIRINAMNEGDDITVFLVYEKLPDFCYACGRLGHSFRQCVDESVDKLKLAFGAWIGASIHISNGPNDRATGEKSERVREVSLIRDGQTQLTDNEIFGGATNGEKGEVALDH